MSNESDLRNTDSRYDVAAAALGALSRSEEADLFAAASVDPALSAELAEMETVVAELARLAPSQPLNRGRSAGMRSRLIARAAGTQVGRSAPGTAAREAEPTTAASAASPAKSRSAAQHPATSAAVRATESHQSRHITGSHVIPFEPRQHPGFGRIAGMVLLAAAVVFAAFGIYSWRGRSVAGVAEVASVSHDSSLESQVASLRASITQKDSLIAALTGLHTRVIDLTAYNSAAPMGRVFWDQKKQMFIMYASNIKQPPAGMRYQMWLIARGGAAPVSAGSFMPDSSGSAIMMARHPMPPGSLRRIAVTAEPDSGTASPTGPVLFVGTAS